MPATKKSTKATASKLTCPDCGRTWTKKKLLAAKPRIWHLNKAAASGFQQQCADCGRAKDKAKRDATTTAAAAR